LPFATKLRQATLSCCGKRKDTERQLGQETKKR
jgi:hypothetical protein